MQWREQDYNRWRTRFAVWPRKIADTWVWLEHYRFRHVPSAEATVRYPLPPMHSPCWLEEFEFSGRSEWRLSTLLGPISGPHREWVKVKPYLKEVA